MKPSVLDTLPLLREYLSIPGNEVGGNLHIVLEDYNVTDADVRHCIALAEACDDTLGVKLGQELLQMSKTQRRKLAGLKQLRN